MLQHNLVQGRSALVLRQPYTNTLDLVQLCQTEAKAAGAVSALVRTEPVPVFLQLSSPCIQSSQILWGWAGFDQEMRLCPCACQPRPVNSPRLWKQTPVQSSTFSKDTQLTSARFFFSLFRNKSIVTLHSQLLGFYFYIFYIAPTFRKYKNLQN